MPVCKKCHRFKTKKAMSMHTCMGGRPDVQEHYFRSKGHAAKK